MAWPRLITAGIVAFWLVMTGLLVRMEWPAGRSSFLSVPVSEVVRLMFQHEEKSALVLRDRGERVGNFYLQPRHLASAPETHGGPADVLALSGSVLLHSSEGNDMGKGTLVMLRGKWVFDPRQEVQRFEVTASFREPSRRGPSFVVSLDGWPAADYYHYQVRSGNSVLSENSGAPAVLLDDRALRPFGVTSAMVGQLIQQQRAIPATARRGILHANGGDIDTYDVTVRHGESLESTIQFSLFGQVLAARTFAGYSLADESLAP